MHSVYYRLNNKEKEEAIKKADTYGVSAIENILRLSCFRFLATVKNEAGRKGN